MEENIILFKHKADCCGCGACINECPMKAITMREDEYGFLYPKINDNFCIRCGACKKVCCYQYMTETNTPLETYAAVTKNSDIMKSASGGIFASIATSVFYDGGVVYGCSMETVEGILTPIHIGVTSVADLEKLQGSKYVQSRIGTTHEVIKEQLKSGKVVLFSGTPCQVAGLKSYLKYNYDNLLTIDIICHGVPSEKLFQDYIAELQWKLKGKIIEFKFRDKAKGWGLTGKVVYKTSKGKIKEKLIPCKMSSYYGLFLQSHTYRENCYSCKYASSYRAGDITIGDYWGIRKEHPELIVSNGGKISEAEGISCVIINNTKGKQYLEKYRSGVDLYPSSFEKAARQNGQLRKPSSISTKRKFILEMYKNEGYKAIDKWYLKELGFSRYFICVKHMAPKTLKKYVKKILGREK